MNPPLFNLIIMKKSILAFALLLVFAGCNKNITYSNKSSEKDIDGMLNDWDRPLRFYSSDAKCSYSIENTDDAILIAIEITDKSTQMKVRSNGLSLYYDGLGKKNQDYGLIYPIMAKEGFKGGPPMDMSGGFEMNMPDESEMRGKYNSELPTRRVINNAENKGFADEWESGTFWTEDDILCLEYRIPLHGSNSQFSVDTSSVKSIGILIDGLAVPSMPQGGPSMGGMPEGGGGPSGSGPPPGMGAQMGGEMTSSLSTWIKFKLVR
jgi:hypothetical protein